MSDRVTAWYEAYAADLLGYIRKQTGGHPDAEDICAQVFFEAVRCADGLDDTPRAWLYKVARCRIVDWRRGQNRRVMVPLDDATDGGYDGPEEQILDRVTGEVVWATTPQLTPMQRYTFWQVYAEDRSIKEVAQCTKLSQTAVKALLSRAKVHLSQNPILNSAPI